MGGAQDLPLSEAGHRRERHSSSILHAHLGLDIYSFCTHSGHQFICLHVPGEFPDLQRYFKVRE